MELGISDTDAKTLGLNSVVKEKIVALVHKYIGHASAVSVTVTEEPVGVQLKTGVGTITVDRALNKQIY